MNYRNESNRQKNARKINRFIPNLKRKLPTVPETLPAPENKKDWIAKVQGWAPTIIQVLKLIVELVIKKH